MVLVVVTFLVWGPLLYHDLGFRALSSGFLLFRFVAFSCLGVLSVVICRVHKV